MAALAAFSLGIVAPAPELPGRVSGDIYHPPDTKSWAPDACGAAAPVG
jgi:hypothetical protein